MQELDESTFYENLTNRWDTLTQTTADCQGMGRQSLNKARKGSDIYLMHEHQENPIFTDIPELNEFKRERVKDGKKNPFLTAPKTVHVPQKCVDSSGNQLGCKFSIFQSNYYFSVSSIRDKRFTCSKTFSY